jgi:hypothetical protein
MKLHIIWKKLSKAQGKQLKVLALYARNFIIDITHTQTKLKRNMLALEIGNEQSK